MKMKIKIKGFRNSNLGLRIWGDGSDRTDGTYGILVPEVQGSVGSRSVATTAPAERGPTEWFSPASSIFCRDTEKVGDGWRVT